MVEIPLQLPGLGIPDSLSTLTNQGEQTVGNDQESWKLLLPLSHRAIVDGSYAALKRVQALIGASRDCVPLICVDVTFAVCVEDDTMSVV